MRQYFFGIIISAFLISTSTAFATSGACSWHGGVNCTAGPGSYGQVICNDGWLGSSVGYYSMDECAAYFGQFQSAALQNKIRQYCYNKYFSMDTGAPASMVQREYDYCLAGGHPTLLDSCRSQLGQYAVLDGYGNCVCSAGYVKDTYSGQCSKPTCPANAYYDIANASCQCNQKFFAVNDQCVSGDTMCGLQYGNDTHYDTRTGGCYCDAGYYRDISGHCSVISAPAKPVVPKNEIVPKHIAALSTNSQSLSSSPTPPTITNAAETSGEIGVSLPAHNMLRQNKSFWQGIVDFIFGLFR